MAFLAVGCLLNGEWRATTASGFRVRIADNELRALQAFGVVDFGTDQVLVAHRVDKESEAGFFNLKIIVVFDFVESEAVLKAWAAAAVNEYAQFQIGVVFFGNQVGYFGAAAIGKNNRACVWHDVIPFIWMYALIVAQIGLLGKVRAGQWKSIGGRKLPSNGSVKVYSRIVAQAD